MLTSNSKLSFIPQRGFTLIELTITIIIIATLAAAALATINPFDQIKKGNDARRKTDLAQIQQALQVYYNDKGNYPASSANYRIFVSPTTYDWGTPWLPYINRLPVDPVFGKNYVYYSPPSANGQTYYLYATLERGSKDQNVCNNGNACVSLTQGVVGFPSANNCGGVCNYGISSPNVSP